MALNLNRRNQAVEVPITTRKRLGNPDQVRDRCIRRFPDVALVMELLPQLIPNIFASFKSAQLIGRIVGRLVSASECAPAWVIKWQHVYPSRRVSWQRTYKLTRGGRW